MRYGEGSKPDENDLQERWFKAHGRRSLSKHEKTNSPREQREHKGGLRDSQRRNRGSKNTAHRRKVPHGVDQTKVDSETGQGRQGEKDDGKKTHLGEKLQSLAPLLEQHGLHQTQRRNDKHGIQEEPHSGGCWPHQRLEDSVGFRRVEMTDSTNDQTATSLALNFVSARLGGR